MDTETPKYVQDNAARGLSISWWEGLSYGGSFSFEKLSEQRHRAVFSCDRPADNYTSNLFQTLKDQELLQKVIKKPYHQVVHTYRRRLACHLISGGISPSIASGEKNCFDGGLSGIYINMEKAF